MPSANSYDLPLQGARIAVLVEHKFIAEETSAYQERFTALGATVEFVSRIWYGEYRPKSVTFYSDVDPLESQPSEIPQPLEVSRDISTVISGDYDAVIMSANYTSVRLRWPDESDVTDPQVLVQSAPAVAWFAKAMANPRVIKGALCHGLWILTPNPDLLKDRKVVCHPVVLADILNCGADAILGEKVVVDKDLVTALSKHEVMEFIDKIAQQIVMLQS